MSTETDGSSNLSVDLRADGFGAGLLARRAGDGGFLFLVVFLVLVLVIVAAAARATARDGRSRLGSWRSKERCAAAARSTNQRAIGGAKQPAEPRLGAHDGMEHPARAKPSCGRSSSSNGASSSSIGVSSSSSRGREPQPLANRKAAHHRREQDDAEHEAIDETGRAEHDRRRAHQRIADHAAEPGRQRPCAAMRPAAGKARRDHRAEDPAAEPQRFAVEGAMGQHAPAPHRDRQDQHDRAEAEDLHQQIGADRAGIAEDVADRARGGVAEARVLHRPRHQRGGSDAGQRDQAEACEFAQAPRQRVADRGRQMADQGNDTFDRWHAHGALRLIQSFDQPMQRLGR